MRFREIEPINLLFVWIFSRALVCLALRSYERRKTIRAFVLCDFTLPKRKILCCVVGYFISGCLRASHIISCMCVVSIYIYMHVFLNPVNIDMCHKELKRRQRTNEKQKKETERISLELSKCCLRLWHNLFTQVTIDSYLSCACCWCRYYCCCCCSLFIRLAHRGKEEEENGMRKYWAWCLPNSMVNWRENRPNESESKSAKENYTSSAVTTIIALRDVFPFWNFKSFVLIEMIMLMVWHVLKFKSLCHVHYTRPDVWVLSLCNGVVLHIPMQ